MNKKLTNTPRLLGALLSVFGILIAGASNTLHAQSIRTIAGNGAQGSAGDGGPATSAQLAWPTAVTVDAAGTIYFVDSNNRKVRKISTDGVISTFAGTGGYGYGGDNGPALEASFGNLTAIAVDSLGNVYLADSGRVRKIDAAGVIQTIAGGSSCAAINYEGPALEVCIGPISGLVVDSAGNVYLSTIYEGISAGRITKISTIGVATTFAGKPTPTLLCPVGLGLNGPASNACLSKPAGLALDGDGNLLIADPGLNKLLKVDPQGSMSVLAEGTNQTCSPFYDAPVSLQQQLCQPISVQVGKRGEIFVGEYEGSRISQVLADGSLRRIAGTATPGFSGDLGPAKVAQLYYPASMGIDPSGRIVIPAANWNRLRRISFNSEPLDFNTDGRAEMLWRDNSSGGVIGWLNFGTSSPVQVAQVLSAGVGEIAHIADLEGSGRRHMLVVAASREVKARLFDGLSLVSEQLLIAAGSGLTVTHVGDFDGDGRDDLLLEHDDGSVLVWRMVGATVAEPATLRAAGSGWHVSHIGDLNGDGKADIIWKSSSGAAEAWLMNGVSASATGALIGAQNEWSISLAADLDGDGKSDLVWRNVHGAAQAWLMNGLSAASIVGLAPDGTQYKPTFAGDYDGDGKTDLIWTNSDESNPGNFGTRLWKMGIVPETGVFGVVREDNYVLHGWRPTHMSDIDGSKRKSLFWRHCDGRSQVWLINSVPSDPATSLSAQIFSLTGPGSFRAIAPGVPVMAECS